MSLVRVQMPSPNHSGTRSSSRLLVVHTSEGATQWDYLGNFLAQPSSQVSYQVGFDDRDANTIGEYVDHSLTAWAAMNANSWGQHGCCCTPSGASQGWSRDDWLGHDNMLRACAAWLSEEADRYQVPIVKIEAHDISAGRSGICAHRDCSAAGAGGSHSDCGPHFPWDVVLNYAIGGSGIVEPAADDYVLLGQDWYPMSIFQSDDDARQAAALTWWATYLSRTPDAANLARWANTIVDKGYAGALNEFLHQEEVVNRMADRPW